MEKPPPPVEGDVDKRVALAIMIIVPATFSTIVVATRFATRIWISKALGWDDWTIFFASVWRA